MSLKSDDYDSSETVKQLIWDARGIVGEPGWRMAGPEIEAFIRYRVADALLNAFSKAEALYINDMVKQADQNSRNMVEAVLAGASLAERKAKEKE
jgi:hypothetical protein